MFEDIEKALRQLEDRDAGWVVRRDAAKTLGDVAARALASLQFFKDEPDTDVRESVDKALGAASAALAGVAPQGGYTLEELVRACEKAGRRAVKSRGDGFEVEVMLKGDRCQTVHVQPCNRADGTELVRVFTYCGKIKEDSLRWALRANTKINQGALAIEDKNGEEQFVLLNCFLLGEVTPREIKSSIKELAFYGDWMEQKLGGLDDF